MRVRNLSGDHFHFRSLRRECLDQCSIRLYKPDKYQRSGQVEDRMCDRRSLGITALSKRCQQCSDGRSDIISQQNRDCSRQSQNTRHSICSRLGCKILQNCNRRTTALYYQCHCRTKQKSKHRNTGYFSDQICKHRTGCQRLHYIPHGLNAKEQ